MLYFYFSFNMRFYIAGQILIYRPVGRQKRTPIVLNMEEQESLCFLALSEKQSL